MTQLKYLLWVFKGLFESSEPYRKKWDIKNHKYTEKSIVDDSEYLNLIIGLILKG